MTVKDYTPLNVTTFDARSDNSLDSTYAKVGDEIRLTLATNGTIETVTGDILGDDNLDVSQSRGDTVIRKIITQSDANGNLTFDIFASNSNGDAVRVTQDNLTSSTIIIDTIPPIITLKGTNNTVSVLNRAYTDLNATAYDLSYGSINIPPTGTVDIGTEGNYTLTYSAQDDLAGNEAQSITRNVIVRDLPPLSLVGLTKFVTSNTNPVYAKAGDTLTLEFSVNDTIVSNTTKFTNPDQIPSVSITDGTYIATLTVPSDQIESYADFEITVENNQTVGFSVTENDFPSVFIDTIAPTIELVGDASHIVYVGTQNPIIPGATVTDGDPGYSPSYTNTTNGTLDTSDVGSTVLYTYTAHPDPAGNPGASIERTVTVVNYDPITVTSLEVFSDNSLDSTYAKVGDEIRLTLATDGLVENVMGTILGDDNFTVSQSRGDTIIRKIITQSDTNGNLTFDILMTNSSGYAARVTQEDITNNNIIIDTVPPLLYLYGVNNTVSYVGSSYVDAGAISYDISYGIQDVTGVGTVDTSTVGTYHITYDVSDSAGHSVNIIRTVHVQQLAPISLTNEKSQFLVSPTANVSDSADYPYLGDSYRVTTVKIGDSTYALIGAYDDSGFTILDITTPESPTLVFNATGNTKINADLNGPTGISTIQIENSIYAVITSLAKSRVAILDITNPTLPIVKSITTPGDNATIHSPFAISTVDIDGTAYALVASSCAVYIYCGDCKW